MTYETRHNQFKYYYKRMTIFTPSRNYPVLSPCPVTTFIDRDVNGNTSVGYFLIEGK